MADHPLRTAIAAETALVQSGTIPAFIGQVGYALPVGADMADYTDAIAPAHVVDVTSGYIYSYDASDTTSTADAFMLVDGLGRRYPISDPTGVSISMVKGRQNTPPGSPAVGDAYIVGVAPTGAWAAWADNLVLYTSRGWLPAAPGQGLAVLNEADGLNWQYSAAGAWALMPTSINDGSIAPIKLTLALGQVVEAEQNAPPGSPVAGLYYIVGTAPTGAWVGQDTDITTYISGAWAFISAYNGAVVRNRADGRDWEFDGSTWAVKARRIVEQVLKRVAILASQANATGTKTLDLTSFTYQGLVGEYLDVALFGDEASNYLSGEIEQNYDGTSGSPYTRIELWRDSEVSAVMVLAETPLQVAGNGSSNLSFTRHFSPLPETGGFSTGVANVAGRGTRFGQYPIADTSSHTYYIRAVSKGYNGGGNSDARAGFAMDGDFLVTLWTA
jgi:uncharacterized protein DUF2793